MSLSFHFNQKDLDKTNTKEAVKKRKEDKAFGDKVMGRKSGVKGMTSTIPASVVGNTKGGHGNFCGQSHIEHKEGSKKGGKGLARV
tara:strand:+ start:5162 stop:5419 length:258 start_codon:yes stop_codon:yes gene_type:complete